MDIIFYIINTLVSILMVVVPLFLIVAYVTYSERKIIGFMQSRMGPTRVGPSGLLQPIADVLKLVSKENVKGIRSAIAIGELKPGRAPTKTPIKTPDRIKRIF